MTLKFSGFEFVSINYFVKSLASLPAWILIYCRFVGDLRKKKHHTLQTKMKQKCSYRKDFETRKKLKNSEKIELKYPIKQKQVKG